MSSQEKWAWWTLATISATIAAYVAFLRITHNGPASMCVFALLALTALPKNSRRYWRGERFDERERMIAEKALLTGFQAFWTVVIAAYLILGFATDWQGQFTVPFWALTGIVWGSAMLMMSAQAIATLLLCRRQLHA